MTDIVLKTAMEQKAAIQNQIAILRNQIADSQAQLNRYEESAASLDRWIETYHQLAGTEAPATAAEHIMKDDTHARRRPKNPDKDVVVSHAIDIIRERNSPQTRKDLFEALASRGIEIRGKDPEMVLSTMLWRSRDRIVRLAPHGYWPADLDYPKAHYDAQFDDVLGIAADEPEDGIETDGEDDDGTSPEGTFDL